MDSNKFDAIVIGSGIGGLTTASLLAQIGKKRVLVVERHFKLGGFTHSFRRKDYEWDAGVHYVGEMQAGALSRRLMDMVTRDGVKWHRMSSSFEKFIFPEGTCDVPDNPKLFEKGLIERFPAEKEKIKQYFRDVATAQHWLARWFVAKVFGRRVLDVVSYFGKKLASMTTADYMARFDDPLLRAFLTAQWPDFGTPPAESAFGFHATVTADFFHGGYYPIGGSKEIAEHAAKAIEDHGGECLVSHPVQRIHVKNGRACGVTVLRKGQEVEFHAPIIISNAGAVNTFGKMVPEEYCAAEREQIKRLKPGPSSLVLFLGLNDDPRKHGFSDCNYWMYSRTDHDIHAKLREGEPERIDGAFLSFGSLRNPGQHPHTAQIITLSDDRGWAKYSDKPWMLRGAEYEAKKDDLAAKMIDYVEQRLPGLKGLIDYQELSTPLSVKSFTDHPGGAIYGQACDGNRLFRDRWMIDTSLRNLYLTGSDVGTPGINGAVVAGAMTAARLLGPLGLMRVMGTAYTR
jgi:phytoene dehydrogenase-like protein